MKGLRDASLHFVPPGITDYGVAKENTVAFLFKQTGIKRINIREMC